MVTMQFDVIALGELLIDFAPVSTDEDGYPTLAAKPGGATANFLAALTAYGAKTAYLCKVGQDGFGALLTQTLEKAGIDVRGVIADPAVFTTLAFVTLGPGGERDFHFARKPGADTCLRVDEIDFSLIDQSRVFHFGTLSLTDDPARTATRAAVAHARAGGKLLTFDPNLRPSLWKRLDDARREILWGLDQADVVKISDEEVEFLWGLSPEEGAERLLANHGVKLAMVTLGPRGALLQNKNGQASAACPPVNPVDTTGAGDIFGGVAVGRILQSGLAPEKLPVETLREIAVFASAAASLSTETFGGIPSIPTEEAVYGVIA